MNVFEKFRVIMVVLIAAGVLGLAGVASAGTQVGVSVSGTRTAVVESGEAHVCTYEQRPVTRTYTDASGGSYEHRTYETVRVCTHAPEYYPKVASKTVYVETRPKARKERRKKRHTSYSVGVGYYGGSPSFSLGYGTSTYYGPSHHYRPYPSRHYGYYGHHYPHSSISLSYGHRSSHHGYGNRGSRRHGHH